MYIGVNPGLATTLTHQEGDTSHMKNIVSYILPDFLKRFNAKNAQYGENDFALGVRGQFPEIWRKCSRLRAILWDGRPDTEVFENVDEVIDDLMGHLLMLKDCLARERGVKADAAASVKISHTPNTPPIDSAAGHAIREAKAGPETWVEYSPGQRREARNASTIGSTMRTGMTPEANTVAIAIAPAGYPRCPWKLGDATEPPVNQCVGYEHHELHDISGMGVEPWHVNEAGKAWTV